MEAKPVTAIIEELVALLMAVVAELAERLAIEIMQTGGE